MPNNLQGTNISDTYQKVVQVEGGQLSDGTGSLLPLSFNSDGVTITGTLHANTISSSRVTSSVIYTSGSSTFGDQASDTHTFLGAITASGNISSSGNISANTFVVKNVGKIQNSYAGNYNVSMQFNNGQMIYGTPTNLVYMTIGGTNPGFYYNVTNNSTNNFRVDGGSDYLIYGDGGTNKVGIGTGTPPEKLTVAGNISSSGYISTLSHITASGNISSSGYLTAQHITSSGNISASSTSYIQTPELRGAGGATQLYVQGQITASGNISSSGTITSLTGSFEKIYAKPHGIISQSGVLGYIDANLYKLQGNRINYDSTNNWVEFKDTGVSVEGGGLYVSGPTANSGHITSSGNISASGNVIAAGVRLPGAGIISFDNSLDGTDQFIAGNDNNIIIDGDEIIKLRADSTIEFQDGSNDAQVTINPIAGHITASGNIS